MTILKTRDIGGGTNFISGLGAVSVNLVIRSDWKLRNLELGSNYTA